MQAARRKLCQIVAFGFINSDPGNLLKGVINKGDWKKFCVPGMNCYSCPAARFSCPVGALQTVNGNMDFSFSFYAVGVILAFGVLMGRWLCGFLCPFGLIQELIHKIPVKKLRLPKIFTYIKYLMLVLVFIVPVFVTDFTGTGEPAFCEYVCPVGTLEGGVPLLLANESLRQLAGPLFRWKIAVLAVTLIGCMFICRFFCKVACPLGAIYGMLNKISAYHLEVDDEKCKHCGKCAAECPMDVDPCKSPNSAECIRCGRCRAVCPEGAIRFRFGYGPGKKKGEITARQSGS
ncbi:MAG: 4Fe-4S binding protein [Clostridia bacterium]|nr:4Fe-4S binding protein [Clostridia bacterium]